MNGITPAAYICGRGDFMVGRYDVTFEEIKVGDCLIEKEGLYYHVKCKCRLPLKDILNLWFVGENQEVNLGICVPDYGLTVRIPVKSLIGLHGRFVLRKKNNPEKIYYLDDDENVYMLLKELPGLRLKRNNGRYGIVIIKDQDQVLPGSDQNL